MMVGQPLIGVGILIVGQDRVEGLRYRIEVDRIGKSKARGDGIAELCGKDTLAVIDAFGGGQAQLQLSTGETLEIVPTDLSLGSATPSFRFVVSGAVPGFTA